MLKELIVDKNPNYFKGVDARQLCLWKVSIRSNDEQALQRAHLDDSNLLHPMRKMYFNDYSGSGHIDIIVRVKVLFFFSIMIILQLLMLIFSRVKIRIVSILRKHGEYKCKWGTDCLHFFFPSLAHTSF